MLNTKKTSHISEAFLIVVENMQEQGLSPDFALSKEMDSIYTTCLDVVKNDGSKP